jgi:hypothetical protein
MLSQHYHHACILLKLKRGNTWNSLKCPLSQFMTYYSNSRLTEALVQNFVLNASCTYRFIVLDTFSKWLLSMEIVWIFLGIVGKSNLHTNCNFRTMFIVWKWYEYTPSSDGFLCMMRRN